MLLHLTRDRIGPVRNKPVKRLLHPPITPCRPTAILAALLSTLIIILMDCIEFAPEPRAIPDLRIPPGGITDRHSVHPAPLAFKPNMPPHNRPRSWPS